MLPREPPWWQAGPRTGSAPAGSIPSAWSAELGRPTAGNWARESISRSWFWLELPACLRPGAAGQGPATSLPEPRPVLGASDSIRSPAAPLPARTGVWEALSVEGEALRSLEMGRHSSNPGREPLVTAPERRLRMQEKTRK